MLKNTLFLFLLFICLPAHAAQNMADIQAFIKQGNHTAAIVSLQQFVKSEPSNYQAWFLLGVAQAERQQFDAAIAAFNHVVVLQPKLAEPHNNLAVIYDETGDIRTAVHELEISLTLKPGYTTAQENLGDLYIKLAADAYRKVLAKSNKPSLQLRYQGLLKLYTNTASGSPQSTHRQQTSTVTPTAINQPIPIQEALKALEVWRIAWSNKNIPSYFSTYSDSFQYGESYKSFAKWKDYKTWAIQKRTFINIKIEHISPTMLSENLVKLKFLQYFRSDSFDSDNKKEMLFKKTANGWKIIYEASM